MTPTTESTVDDLRARIDQVDAELIALWRERADLSAKIGATRIADGGPRLVLAREQAIVDRYRAALGPDGAKLAMLVLRAGRGPL